MDFDLPPDDDPRRLAVRSWLAEHPAPTQAQLAEAGYVAPHWPAPWGLGADAEHQLVLDDEMTRAGLPRLETSIAVGWAGPTLLAGGTEAQQQRYLPGILDGSEVWCQLFSEPEAGSDLAALRTRAVRDGDEYVVDGQKTWTTWADVARYGILLARVPTEPGAPKHEGITYFVLDMTSPGVEVRRIIEMTGGNHFNEVFLSDVRIPVADRIGDEGDGWRLAKVTLGNERLSLSEGGVLWGMGPTGEEVVAHLRTSGVDDAVLRQRAAEVSTEVVLQRLHGQRILTLAQHGQEPGAEASIRKALADQHGQHAMGLVKDLRGAAGMLGTQHLHAEEDDVWHWGYLFSPALTIGGGTSEVQRSIIGERLLGLPREPQPQPQPDLVTRTAPEGRSGSPDQTGGTLELTCVRFVHHLPSTPEGAPVLEVVLDRPGDELNRIDATVHHELSRVVAALRHEDEAVVGDARAVLVTAAGRAFSAGGDFSWFPELQDPERAASLAVDARSLVYDLLDVELPVVCAVQGPAVGLGASLALLCDVVFLARSASIADPHVRVGIAAGDGGTVAWPTLVGPVLAKRHLLTGDPVDADDAHRLGLVSHVVDDQDLHHEALAFAQRLAAGAPQAVRATKRAINATLKDQARLAFEPALEAEVATFATDDHREALAALAERRPPRFTGR